ncbi:phosphotransferase [Candidatus Palauibacter sp.]|uniref:phosphotransferase n=1 Tax=Candidatus Palauibacter sp. TaxID=3101350 RepID=UPI003B5AC82D
MILVRNGVLSGVIDWGDLGAGDVATDLASVWMLFDDGTARAACLESYGPSEPLVVRAIGWATIFGTVLGDDERLATVAFATLRRLAEDL